MKYAIVDLANSFFRAKHIASRNTDSWQKVGMALHICLTSINHVVRNSGVDHIVVALEGKSWRKGFYKPYKAPRAIKEADLTEAEVEENKLFWETYDAFVKFLTEKTNVSVTRCSIAEADDVIARFIKLHPNDEHVIVSSDTDFYQLLSETVSQYNGITNQLITINGFFDDRNKPVIDKKTKVQKTIGDPKFVLFEKCMRGDPTDNVFSAYPGVRTKGTKNKIGLMEAYEDKDKKGWNWNNMMLQRWTDHNEVEHIVRDDYERNKTLIDLDAQPQDIKDAVDLAIIDAIRKEPMSQTGLHLLKFCGKYELVKISEQSDTYAKWLGKSYKGILLELLEEQ